MPVKMTLDAEETLFSDPVGTQDQMLRAVEADAKLEVGSMAELVFDQQSSAVSSSKEIEDPLQLGYNVYDNIEY